MSPSRPIPEANCRYCLRRQIGEGPPSLPKLFLLFPSCGLAREEGVGWAERKGGASWSEALESRWAGEVGRWVRGGQYLASGQRTPLASGGLGPEVSVEVQGGFDPESLRLESNTETDGGWVGGNRASKVFCLQNWGAGVALPKWQSGDSFSGIA